MYIPTIFTPLPLPTTTIQQELCKLLLLIVVLFIDKLYIFEHFYKFFEKIHFIQYKPGMHTNPIWFSKENQFATKRL